MSTLLKKRFFDQIKVLFGAEPKKPTNAEHISPAAQTIHFYKKGNKDYKLHAQAHEQKSTKWRNRRWATLTFANLLFVISFGLDRKSTRLNSSHITISYAVF